MARKRRPVRPMPCTVETSMKLPPLRCSPTLRLFHRLWEVQYGNGSAVRGAWPDR